MDAPEQGPQEAALLFVLLLPSSPLITIRRDPQGQGSSPALLLVPYPGMIPLGHPQSTNPTCKQNSLILLPQACFPLVFSRLAGPSATLTPQPKPRQPPTRSFLLPTHSNLCPGPGSHTSSMALEYVPVFPPALPLLNSDTVDPHWTTATDHR